MCESKTNLAEIPDLGVVRRCGCGCIHLTIGPVTVRLEAAALPQLAAMLHEAAEKQAQIAGKEQSRASLDGWKPANPLPN